MPSRRQLAAIWLAAALVVGGVLLAARILRTAGDDGDPGRQRPGILDLGPLPEPAPAVSGIDLGRGRTVVFFARPDRADDLCAALRGHPTLDGARVVLVAEDAPGSCPRAVDVVTADVRATAAAFGLPAARGDVTPTGYAIVDGRGRIRYRTLDPVAPELIDEVETMLRGVE